MKHIILTFFVFIFSILPSFAETLIDFSSDKIEYNIEDTIEVSLTIQSDNSELGEINIKGMENFRIAGRRQSHSTQIVNGSALTQLQFQLSLIAKEAGEYSLGPVVIHDNGKEVQSDSLSITVTGERIMLNPQVNSLFDNTEEEDKQEEQGSNIDDELSDVILGEDEKKEETNTSDEHIEEQTITGVDGEEMNDIYGEKGFLIGNPIAKQAAFFLLIALLGAIFYLILKKYLESINEERPKQKKKPSVEETEIVAPKKAISYKTLLKSLEEEYLEAEKELFYSQAADIMRIYLDDTFEGGLSQKSLQELQQYKQIDTKVLDVYTQLYYPEYNNETDSIEERTGLIAKMKKLFL